jgi:hypothetical protein
MAEFWFLARNEAFSIQHVQNVSGYERFLDISSETEFHLGCVKLCLHPYMNSWCPVYAQE